MILYNENKLNINYTQQSKLNGICLAACLACFLSLKMETICSFKISVNFYQTLWHHISEDGSTLQSPL
jgi:hypothetical protein